MTEETLFQRKLRERREAEVRLAAEQTTFADVVPEDEPSGKSEQDIEMDRIINGVSIVEAYQRWCNKSPVKPRGGQTEGIKVSCPKPSHPDKDPSAWINSEKNTWFCGGCQEGGDAYDIAAYHFSFPVPGYKSGASFHDLRRKMAESLGYTFISPPGVSHPIPVAPDPAPVSSDEQPTGGPVPGAVPEETNATVIDISRDWFEEEIVFPTLEWRDMMDEGTFLDRYMHQCHIDDVPEEYHFWNGLLALGFAVGRDVTLFDRVPVYANLFVCLLGNTGDGKSRSFSHLRKLLYQALPHKWDDFTSKGTHVVGTPASAEVLIHNFSKPILDPSDPKKILGYAPVRGLIEFNEFSALTARTNRQGNALKPTLMEFYDMAPSITTSSMSTGKKQADFPFASTFTTTQPRSMRDLMRRSDADSGFLNRWIFASGKQKDRIAIGGIQVDIAPAVKPLEEIFGWSGLSKVITWDEDAAKLFTEFFHAVLLPKQQDDQTGMLTRLDLTMKKLILLLTINLKLVSVPVEIVDRVIKMYNYLISAYAIPSAQIGNTTQIEIQEEILRQCQNITNKYGRGPTYRELTQNIKHKKFQPGDIHKMLKIMCDMGEIDAVTTPAGSKGRPSVRYRYVG